MFFIAPEFQRDCHLPVKVIHTVKLGPERDDAGRVDEIEWLSYDTRKNLAGAAITLPKWPVWFYDKDNAMLLQLFSDPIMGWMWGDVSHIAFILPRSELAQANFDNTLAVIGG